MADFAYEARLRCCGELMRAQGLDVLLLTKPSNMFYFTGDGRLCAYAMLTQEGKVALGVPSTDVVDVAALAGFDRIAGFEDEVGMLHAIAHHFRRVAPLPRTVERFPQKAGTMCLLSYSTGER